VYQCLDYFEGGGWALVRRSKQGSTWSLPQDGLKGTAVYGTYGAPYSDQSFSIRFDWALTATTEYLFMSGMSYLSDVQHVPHFAILQVITACF
jgi:hypothetical protein